MDVHSIFDIAFGALGVVVMVRFFRFELIQSAIGLVIGATIVVTVKFWVGG